MTFIYLVSAKQFTKLYNKHIAPNPDNQVHWFVENSESIKLFIRSTINNDIYCYNHLGDFGNMVESMKEMIRSGFEILGLYEEPKEEPVKIRQMDIGVKA